MYMGRFYDGDIEGKFWFGVQDSSDIENLISITPTYIFLGKFVVVVQTMIMMNIAKIVMRLKKNILKMQ